MEAQNPVTGLIGHFGGLRKLMRAVRAESPNLVQNWEKNGRIPHYREDQIKKAAEDRNVEVPPDLWTQLFPDREPA